MSYDPDDIALPEAVIVFNPRATRAARWRDPLRSGLARLGVRRWYESEAPGHARELACAAAKDGAGLVVVAGGDGTVHEIANGLLGSAVAFFPLALGAGNDLVRSLGLPRSVPAALEGLARRRARPLDAARVNGREVFVNAAGFGFDAEVARRRTGRSYTGAVVRTFLGYEPTEIEVVGSEKAFRGRVLSVSIANGSCVGGGYRIAPAADPGDGRLDVCIFEPVGPVRFVRGFVKVRRGRHGDLPAFHTWRDSRVTLRGESLAAHLDGEVRSFPPGSDVTVEVLPGALRVWA